MLEASLASQSTDPPTLADLTVSVAEAARQLGVSRARVYALVQQGQLDPVIQGDTLHVTRASVNRRRAAPAATGAPLSPATAWATLALATGDPALVAHLRRLFPDRTERARVRTRLEREGLLAIVPRLHRRAVVRRFSASAEAVEELARDPGLVLTGVPAARALGWQLPEVATGHAPGVDGYVSELRLAGLVDRLELEREGAAGAVLLRAIQEPWPFPPQLRVAPPIVVALDLAEAGARGCQIIGRRRLKELATTVVASWRPRHVAKPPSQPLVPTAPQPHARPRYQTAPAVEPWDDRVLTDARQLIALLFVAGKPLGRAAVLEHLKVGRSRLARACALLREAPPFGLTLVEHADELSLASAGDCAPVVERYLQAPPLEPLSSAAHQVLAIVAYEQPVTRADVERLRGVESGGVIDSLLARGLVAEERRFGMRGGPVPLMTTAAFLRQFGLSSLADLPPLVSVDEGASRDIQSGVHRARRPHPPEGRQE